MLDYLRESFTSQDGIVKLVLALALYVALAMYLNGNGDMGKALMNGAVYAVLLGLLCAVYMWVKENYLEKEEEFY